MSPHAIRTLAQVHPLTVLALFVASAKTQTPEEIARLSVTVRDTNGKPVAGATIERFTRPVPDHEGMGTANSLLGTSDEHGRTRLDVVSGTNYGVWGHRFVGAAADDGRRDYEVTRTAENCTDSRPVALEFLPETQRSGPVHVRGLTAWETRGPFRVRFVAQTRHVWTREVAVVDDVVELPPMPRARRSIEILDAKRSVLHVLALDDRVDSIDVPPPGKTTLVVRNGYRGEPIAGAAVVRRTRVHEDALGRTNERGELEIVLPAGTAPSTLRILARGFERGLAAAADEPDATLSPKNTWFADLRAAPQARSLRFAFDGRPCANLCVRRAARAFRYTGRTSGSSLTDAILTRTDDAGIVRVDGDEARRVEVYLPLEQRTSFFGDTASIVHPLVFVSDDGTLSTIALDQFRVVELSVTQPDGSPSCGTELLIVESPDPASSLRCESTMTDRRGRARVLLPSQRIIRVLAIGDAHHGLFELRIPRPVADRALRPVRLMLAESFVVTGHVTTDESGKRPTIPTQVFCAPLQEGDLRDPAKIGTPKLREDWLHQGPVQNSEVLFQMLNLAMRHDDRFRRRGPDFEYRLPRVAWRYLLQAYAVRSALNGSLEVDVTDSNGSHVIRLRE
ncbi:MAG: Ig-like domain-containing protein [Planctomycetes bacterium]|nr:Ig-like domain-containing protein [Planctomycetota bacterium]